MTLILFLKLVGSSVAIFSIGKIIYEIIISKKVHLREEYIFAKNFLNDVDKGGLHPFALEKGYQALANSTEVNTDEIAYILSLKNSARRLKDFVLSNDYLEHINSKGSFELMFKEKYNSDWSRSWRRTTYFISYFILALLTLSPFILSTIFKTTIINIFIQLALTIPFFGYFAWRSLLGFVKIHRAQKLIDNQQKHTQNIQTKT